MGILNNLFGYRWSLYIVRHENQVCYAMHADSVMGIIGYVMNYFEDGFRPVEPWSLYLNFNRKHQTIKLAPEHFSGSKVSRFLIERIEALDTDWQQLYRDPVFEEAASKKRLPISGKKQSIEEMFENAKAEQTGNKTKEVTFFSIMQEVFGNNP
jgi:hypothetical protein